jgi:hypothetical protein
MDSNYQLEQKLIAEVEAAHRHYREIPPRAHARTDAPIILQEVDWEAVRQSRARLAQAELALRRFWATH